LRRVPLLTFVLAGALTGCGPDDVVTSTMPEPTAAVQPAHFDVERIVSGLDRPTYVGAAPGDPDALWALEQPGRVLRLEDDQPTVALDLSDAVGVGTEQGLLGIAFHPGFASNGRVFLHWTDLAGDTRVAEFAADPDRRSIAPQPLRELLFVDQPEANHNGGHLAFGPDGRLYLGLGDGGGAFDPGRTAQDTTEHLGKILATDVDAEVPAWDAVLVGLRNPWRFWLDPALDEMWVADVGQDEVEEVNRVSLEPDEPPKNLGWSAYEGTARITDHELDPTGELVEPVVTYGHDEGCSIIGGPVYGGTQLPEMSRRYVYGDFCAGTLWSLRGTAGGGATDVRIEQAKVPQLTHIGEDADGELVFASANGSLYRTVPVPPEAEPSPATPAR
jgi:glucose/arabinose dehydrogenase